MGEHKTAREYDFGDIMNEAFDKLSKEQVIHLIIWQMFEKHISLKELTEAIKKDEKEIVRHVNEHLSKILS